ncbi:MAG: response regulator [Ardenticatenaceae bacterium]
MMRSKGNILVVDDTLPSLRLLVEMLADQGYEVRPAPNGALALRAVYSTRPDLILLDIKMPGMDGYQVCERLKADERSCDIPVIFISALNDVLDKVKAFSVGAVDYITKPFQLEEVLARVQTHLTLRRLQTRLEERTRELTSLLKVSHQVVSTLELEPLLSMILDQLEEVVAYTASAILTLKEDELIVVASRGPIPEEEALQFRFNAAPLYANLDLFSDLKPLIVADIQQNQHLIDLWRETFAHHHLDMILSQTRSWIGAPLIVGEQIIGLLSLSHHEPNYYSPQQAELVSAFVNHTAVAIQNAKLYQQAQAAAAAEERNRLARDLHDSVTQSLYSSTLFIEASRELAKANDLEGTTRFVTRTGEIIQQALKEMRLLVYQLRPPELKEQGLIGALQQRLDIVEKRAGVEARLLMDDLIDLPSPVEEQLYRIAQEALNNALKHAQATSIRVHLRTAGDKIILEIVDNGQGFDPDTLEDRGMGLISMSERAEQLGGKLIIESAPEAGTKVKVSVEIS